MPRRRLPCVISRTRAVLLPFVPNPRPHLGRRKPRWNGSGGRPQLGGTLHWARRRCSVDDDGDSLFPIPAGRACLRHPERKLAAAGGGGGGGGVGGGGARASAEVGSSWTAARVLFELEDLRSRWQPTSFNAHLIAAGSREGLPKGNRDKTRGQEIIESLMGFLVEISSDQIHGE